VERHVSHAKARLASVAALATVASLANGANRRLIIR
jgi:hypothetical protein